MILSHRHRFIFLKTSKTAGTSIEIALSRFCGPDDVITPLGEDERERRRLGGRAPQNHMPPGVEVTVQTLEQVGYFNHMWAALARSRAPQAWESYFKFCVVRNPWERAASIYSWIYRKAPARPSFSEFVAHEGQRLRVLGWRIYSIDGRVAVDRALRYENLAADLEAVRQHLGLPAPLELPRTKVSTRPADYRSLMNQRDVAAIGEICREEIETFGYRF